MNKITVMRIVEWLISQDVIREEDRNLYHYALNNLLHAVLPIFLSLMVGIILRCPARAIVIIIPFVVLRRFCGGFHMKNAWVCMFSSTVLLVDFVLLSFLIHNLEIVFFCAAFSGVSLLLLSPVENENKPLSPGEKARCKAITEYVVSILFLLLTVLYCFRVKEVLICAALGIMLPAVLQYPVFIEKVFTDT